MGFWVYEFLGFWVRWVFGFDGFLGLMGFWVYEFDGLRKPWTLSDLSESKIVSKGPLGYGFLVMVRNLLSRAF